MLLTFDDAISCHYNYVYKILKKRDLWGIFYVPTQPYQRDKMLDVHRIHLLCGAFEGLELLDLLKTFLDQGMISDNRRKEFQEKKYRQDNYDGVSQFKKILNYYVSYKYREYLINLVADKLNYVFVNSEFYIPANKLKEIQLAGNIIGSHTVTHPLMSKLTQSEQLTEINNSFRYLSSNINLDVKTYCHPYGGFYSFNKDTVKTLENNRVDFSFNVEWRDICDNDLTNSIQFYLDMTAINFRLVRYLSYQEI